MTDSPAATSPSRWRLYGARRTAPEGDEVFAAIGTDPRHTMAYGYAPDAVEELDAVEDPDGRYWGWLRNTNRDRSQPPVYADFPAMVHESRSATPGGWCGSPSTPPPPPRTVPRSTEPARPDPAVSGNAHGSQRLLSSYSNAP